MDRDEIYMRKALELAEIAAEQLEVPVGAIVVKKSTGEIVGRGFNRREYGKSPLTHAEVIAIDQASKKLGGWRLIDCELYVTLEPCPMCAGAIINSRVERVVFGAYDKKAGSCGSVVNLFELPYNHKPELVGGVLETECSAVLSEFFSKLRKIKKLNKKAPDAEK
ncbi:tRNA adenosine(34) deaminase TadA [uncultured Ruminococcus sp.]|uniref:tRNA adenosine(34) deaminase TadA n=1 Tax=uncultured Ruminococcus sp. TaxID=165186 RepID=UPI0025F28339|nr:tRNA adenosine(34) deaminase TadA [uncultured Ruminococcus sp.]